MMTGNNAVLLNAFCNDGIDALKKVTPWAMLRDQLANKRYDYLENIIDNLWTVTLIFFLKIINLCCSLNLHKKIFKYFLIRDI